MANHKSAEKRIRQTERRTTVNASRLSRIRTFVRKVETSIAAGDVAGAKESLNVAQSELMRGVSKGVLKLNAAARKVSRLSARVKALNVAKA
jgi:small subunit ribosomal protein S20